MKLTPRGLRALALIALCNSHGSLAAPISLYDGTGSPLDQGWGGYSPLPYVSFQNSGTPADVLTSQTSGVDQFLYYHTNAFSEFFLNTRMRVISGSHNFLDGGCVVSVLVDHSVGQSVGLDRYNSFYFEPGLVGFMDEGSSHSFPNATSFHEFSILVTGGTVKLFVDQTYSNIMNGNVSPALSRAIPGVPGIYPTSYIAFGDQTNDAGVNSHFQIDQISFEGITPTVPEPSTTSLMLIASLMIFNRRKADGSRSTVNPASPRY